MQHSPNAQLREDSSRPDNPTPLADSRAVEASRKQAKRKEDFDRLLRSYQLASKKRRLAQAKQLREQEQERQRQQDEASRREQEANRRRAEEEQKQGALGAWWVVLELPPTASLEDIKRRFRPLAKQHHPDKGGDEETFKRIHEAYKRAIMSVT